MDRLWRSNSSISSRTGCPLGTINDEDHKVESCDATIDVCLHGMNSKILKNNALSMADASLNDHACFNASCLYDNDKTVYPSSTPTDNQLRVLTISKENFKVDLVLLYDEFMLSDRKSVV